MKKQTWFEGKAWAAIIGSSNGSDYCIVEGCVHKDDMHTNSLNLPQTALNQWDLPHEGACVGVSLPSVCVCVCATCWAQQCDCGLPPQAYNRSNQMRNRMLLAIRSSRGDGLRPLSRNQQNSCWVKSVVYFTGLPGDEVTHVHYTEGRQIRIVLIKAAAEEGDAETVFPTLCQSGRRGLFTTVTLLFFTEKGLKWSCLFRQCTVC